MSGVLEANFASWLTLPTDTSLPNFADDLKTHRGNLNLFCGQDVKGDMKSWGLYVPLMCWLF